MNKLAKKLKELVKGECPKPTYGTDPNDPWSAKAGITENLSAYLMSKGIDPKSLSRSSKISHSKSNEYLKWKRDHQFEEVEYVTEDKLLDTYLIQHGINPKNLPVEKKVAYSKTNDFIKWKENHMHEQIAHESPTKEKQKILDKKEKSGKIIRQEEIADPRHAPATHVAIVRDKKGLVVSVANVHGKDTDEAKKRAKDKVISDVRGEVSKVEKIHSDNVNEDVFADSQAATQSNFDGANAPDNTEPSMPGVNRRKELSKSARIIKSIYKRKGMKEDMDMKGPWDKDHDDPYYQGLYGRDNKNPHKKGSKEHHEYESQFKLGRGDQKSVFEEYVKEDMYDHEKEDKSVSSYGKKPKMVKVPEDKLKGDNAPRAAAVLSGGKTLTGQSRDTLEIDPEMKRPIRFDNKLTNNNKDK